MRYMVERNFVQVVGHIWQPNLGVCAMTYTLEAHDVSNLGDFTRENVEQWLASHAGDFSEVVDFAATVGDEWIEWDSEDNEGVFNDCMFQSGG